MRCAKTLGNGCRGPTGRALRQPTPVELVTCEWPPGLRPSWPPYPPARATGAVAATTFSLSAGLPKQHEDISLLVKYFLDVHQRDHGLAHAGFELDAIELLRQQPWPGNVRELANVIL